MALEWLNYKLRRLFLREDFGGLGLLGPRTAHAGGCFGRTRGLGPLWPSLGWRRLGISGTPPVLFVISSALHGSTTLGSEVVPRRCTVLIELHRLQVAGLQGSGTGGDDWAPWLHVDFQPSISLTEMGFFKPPKAANGFRVAKL